MTNELSFPIRHFDDNGHLERNFRHAEEWARQPHRTYGSRMIAPMWNQENNNVDAFTIESAGSGGFGAGVWDGLVLELDHRSRAFIWATAEFANTDGADDYHLHFFLPVEVGGVLSPGKGNREFFVHSANKKVLTNMRSVYIDTRERKTVKFQWGFQNGTGSSQDGTVYARRMIVAIFDGSDVAPNQEIAWTRSLMNQAAYRHQEEGDVL